MVMAKSTTANSPGYSPLAFPTQLVRLTDIPSSTDDVGKANTRLVYSHPWFLFLLQGNSRLVQPTKVMYVS